MFSFKTVLTVAALFVCIVPARDVVPEGSPLFIERAAACAIDINGGLPEPQPLLIVPGKNQFFEPKNGIIYIEYGESVELYCSGSFVAPFTKTKTLLASCSNNNLFNVNGNEYAFSSFACTNQVSHTARRTKHKCGTLAGETLSEIGFKVNERFLPIMNVCHNELTESTLYSHFTETPSGFQHSIRRPSFITGDYFGRRNIGKLYSKGMQKKTIGRILGETRIEQLFKEKKDLYLARGHLAAKADFPFGTQQQGTFYFINVAPQWQKFNGGNWESVESSVRAFVSNRNIYADIYTGTWGILELQDFNGNYKKIYLDHDKMNRGLIPVPELYYKVVIDTYTQKGIVLIGVNNPYATLDEIAQRYTICKDYSYLINWINWDRTNVRRGYSYACDVNDFIQTVNHLPLHVKTTGLLY